MVAVAGEAAAEVAGHAGHLLERSLLGELRAVAARALSGLDMFSGDLGDLLASDASAFQLAAGGSSPPSQAPPPPPPPAPPFTHFCPAKT